MSDRTVDIWGARTPTARGSGWTERVDVHLDGVGESDVDRWVASACVLCGNGCGCDIAVKGGRMVGIRGRATDRVNHGRMGPKGLYGSTPWASSPDRLTRPLVRDGGGLVETGWDAALGRVVERSRAAGRGLRDEELLSIAQHCDAETTRQISWLETRLKVAAPQALIVA